MDPRVVGYLAELWSKHRVDERTYGCDALRAYVERFPRIAGRVQRGVVDVDLSDTTLIEGSIRHSGKFGPGRTPDVLVDLAHDEFAERTLVAPLRGLAAELPLARRVAAAREAVQCALPHPGIGDFDDVLDFEGLLRAPDTLLEPYQSLIDELEQRRATIIQLGELLRAGTGDCRAYAIATEIALKSAGVAGSCLAYFMELTPGGEELGDQMLNLVYHPGDDSDPEGIYLVDSQPPSAPYWNGLFLRDALTPHGGAPPEWRAQLPGAMQRTLVDQGG